MSLAVTGMRVTQIAGAAGAMNLSLQMVQTQSSLQIGATPKTGPAVGIALPAIQAMDTTAVVAIGSLSAVQSPTAHDQQAQEKQLTDAINVKTNELWSLAVRFFANPEAFTQKLTANKSKTDTRRAVPVRLKQHAAANIPSQPKVKTSAKTEEANHSEPAPTKQQRMSKTKIAVALTGDAIPVKNVSLKLPRLPRASTAAQVDESTMQAVPHQGAPLISDAAVTVAKGPIENIVPYSRTQLDRAQTVLRAAGVTAAKTGVRNTSEVSRSFMKEAGFLRGVQGSNTQTHLRGVTEITPRRSQTPSHPFKRSHAAGRSPAFLVGNIKAKKARKADPAQIVRVATNGSTKRSIVFARVPGTRGEYRFAGVDHQQKTHAPQERAAPHALMMPHAERNLHRSGLGLAPPTAAGETAYTMPDPRELREDEREALVGMLKEQLALGPASLNDPSIRERFNSFMFSNTVGEMSHYITADQWNAMVRATVLYAARVVLPFSNNSIAQKAADQLFDVADAQSRYTEWTKHFGVTELSDVALLNTFADENRLLTMPEYFLKGIMDHMIERAPELHGYDEDAMPLLFTTELHLQWETIGFIHDPAISNNAQLIEAATSFAEEIAALDAYAAQHFLELVMLSTRVSTDSIQGVWNEDQAIALVGSSIKAGLSDIIDPIGRNRSFPRRIGRLIAIAKQARNASEDQYQIGLDRLTRNLAELVEGNPGLLLQTDPDESEELHPN